jgi:hypothetical protein
MSRYPARKRRPHRCSDIQTSDPPQQAAIQFARRKVASSANAHVQVTMSRRQLEVSLLPFTHRWPPMSGLDISERVLPTLNGHLSHGSALARIRPTASPENSCVRFPDITYKRSVFRSGGDRKSDRLRCIRRTQYERIESADGTPIAGVTGRRDSFRSSPSPRVRYDEMLAAVARTPLGTPRAFFEPRRSRYRWQSDRSYVSSPQASGALFQAAVARRLLLEFARSPHETPG